MSRQSNRNTECNIYSQHYNDRAEDISDRSLNGEIVQATDTIGWTLSEHGLGDHVLPDDGAQTHGKTGSARGGHGRKADIEGGSSEVRNRPARHERETLADESPTHQRESITSTPNPVKR